MRVNSYKTGSSELFYIKHTYRNSNGKSTSKNVRTLGKLEDLMKELNTDRDGVITWCNEQARLETAKYKEDVEPVTVTLYPNKPIDPDKDRVFSVGYLFIQKILYGLRIDNICRNITNRHKNEYSIESILTDLVYARVLDPCSKRSSYNVCQSFLEKPKYELHHVYRSLSILAKESEYIQSELYKNSNFLHKRNTKILYYDCTNYYFEIQEEDGSKQYGKGKENRPNPIVGMGLFMDADGYPLAFSTFPGNMNEQKTLKPLEKRVIRDFDCAEFIYCSDSGLASVKNKQFNHMGGRNYVITQSLKKLSAKDRDIALNPKQYRKVGSKAFIDISTLDETISEVYESIYYKEIPITTKDKDGNVIEENMIVTYSPKYKAYLRKVRQGQIERASAMITNGGDLKKKRRNQHDPARFLKTTAITKEGEVAEEVIAEIDNSVIEEEERYDGFYAVTTDTDLPVTEVIKINKQRWQIEECFRIMKTDFEARPVYVSREDSIQAHFLICFIALLVYRLLDTVTGNQFTCEKLLSTLRSMKMTLLEGAGYIPSYRPNEITNALHTYCGFRTDVGVVKKAKMKSIIKMSKES